MRYDFDCKSCLKRFEVEYKLDEDGKEVLCPICGGIMVKILTAVRFKVNR